jgi:hypothetical protein
MAISFRIVAPSVGRNTKLRKGNVLQGIATTGSERRGEISNAKHRGAAEMMNSAFAHIKTAGYFASIFITQSQTKPDVWFRRTALFFPAICSILSIRP